MTTLQCICGQTTITVSGPPILAVDCCCTSCRTAALRLQTLPGVTALLGPHAETRYIHYRKDRVALPPPDRLRSFRLTPQSKTRRVLAACCNAPLFLEFTGGHWLSLYATLWPAGTAPPADLRSMTSDLPDPSVLPDDIPNARTQNARFMLGLLTAWIAMGFRIPKIATGEDIDV